MGICDERGQWIGLHESVGQRSSAQLHADLHQLCEAKALVPRDIGRVVYLAGPGFYTGLRIAYGIAQTLKLSGVKSFSFYAHHIPELLGESDYIWITKAYRGEVFVYRSSDRKVQLLGEKDFYSQTWPSNCFIHSQRALDDKLRSTLVSPKETEGQILREFPVLLDKLRDEDALFYFRAPEDEFRPSS